MIFRTATSKDAPLIAQLHAESWRRHYRGAYSDSYLDNEADEERLRVWTERLAASTALAETVIAADHGEVIGFAHTILDVDASYGALLDNLHVRHDRQRSGVGSQLMARSAAMVVNARQGQGLFLWVLEQNVRAQAFYQARGGTFVAAEPATAPDGTPIIGLRYTWPDPSVLLAP